MEVAKRNKSLDRDKDKLKRDIEKEVIKFFDHVLDVSEVAIGDPHRFKAFRSKVLRAGNDAIREIKKFVDRDFEVKFISHSEHVIEVQRPSISNIKRDN